MMVTKQSKRRGEQRPDTAGQRKREPDGREGQEPSLRIGSGSRSPAIPEGLPDGRADQVAMLRTVSGERIPAIREGLPENREAETSEAGAKLQQCPRVGVALKQYKAVQEQFGAGSAEAAAAERQLVEVAKAAKARDQPDAVCIPIVSAKDPRESLAERRQVHNDLLAGGLYEQLTKGALKSMLGKGTGLYAEAHATTVLHARDVLEAMKPRDPLEEMLVAQALWTHARVAKLSQLLSFQTDANHIRMLTESADKASNTYRRLMLALADYRRPPKAGDIINAIQQANIAGQQVIQYGDAAGTAPKKPANEQGFTDAAGTEPPSAAPALPSDPGGPAFFTGDHPAEQALGARDGAEDGRGQGRRPHERMEAR